MNKISKLVIRLSLATAYSFGCINAVYADDTEVFFAPASSVSNIKPNVMFIIDTSGSMNWGIDGTSNPPDAERRINIVKSVMNDLLTELKDVKAGLMRFNRGNSSDSSAKGGPVLFPILDIDLPATPIVEQEVSVGVNDGYENPSTTMFITSDQLYLDGPSAAYTGVRFTGLNLPQGATIKRASVSFTANGNSTGAALMNIYAQKIDTAPVLTTTATDISARMPTATTAFTSWVPSDWTSGESYVSQDFSAVIQEIVNQPGWCGGNDLMLLIQGTGGAQRIAYSAEGEAAAGGANENSDNVSAAKIRIEYEPILPGGANGCISGGERTYQIVDGNHDVEEAYSAGATGNQLDFEVNNRIGVAFTGIDLPRNTVINDAYLEFTSRANDTGGASWKIRAVDDDQPPLNTTMIALASGAYTSAVTWSGIPNWTNNSSYRTVSVKSLVQAVVNRSDWDAGDNIAFKIDIDSGSNNRRAYTFNSSPGQSARLIINGGVTVYTPGSVTIREDLKRAVQSLPATGNTPISDTIAEAGLYFRGEDVLWGKSRNLHQDNRVSHSLSYNNGTLYTPAGCTEANPNATACKDEKINGNPRYISPIEEACQTNHIVYLTDGAPTSHHVETENVYAGWTGGNSCNHGNAKADCAVDIAGFLFKNPWNGNRPINTHMIGFGAGADPALMKKMADAGGGGHYSAQSKEQLVGVLKTIINSIASVSTTFVTTGVTVNQYNRLTHSEQLYFSLFTPSSKNVWPGNVKRYRLSGGEIVDAKGNNAVDKLSSEFSKEAQSYWSDFVDGNQVNQGGVAEQLTTSRVIYTNLTSADIDATANRFNRTNITSTHLGAANDDDRKTIIDWTLGFDVTDSNYNVNDTSNTPPHKQMADPLHSQPTIVSFKSGSSSKNRDLVFVGTNDGFLRAFDADASDGSEVWSFLPKELFDRLSNIQKGLVSSHNYGLDGPISVFIKDTNKNGQVDVDSGEKAYLYVGMRRGGRSYYALDISDPTAPNLMFIISGDADVGPGQVADNYSKLGQTWSRPIIGKMNLPGVNSDKLVMIFGGGYDSGQDLAGTASATDTIGNIVYIADALSGAILWTSAEALDPGQNEGPLNFNSIPADITAFDLDGDDLVDHMYASDTRAQIFRFDVNKTTQKITGGRIASLQTAADEANNRRFYYPVDAALIKLIDDSFISVSIGSGYRAHPLNEAITDHFYMIRDEGVLKGQFDMDVTQSDLTDVTSLIGDTDGDGTSDAAAQMKVDGNKGWYIGFSGSGEKVIERSITFNNAVIFTTYLPPGSNSTACEAAAGGSRIYGLRIVDGNPYLDTNFDGVITESDRYADLVGAGIAPPPQVLLEGTDEGVKPRLCVGTQCNLEDFLPDTTKGIVGYKWRN